MSHSRVAGAVVLFSVVAAGVARADAIDGDWCDNGSHLSIAGPEIVTPGGSRVTGEYHRHYFIYVIPPSEAGAGHTMNLRLANETTMLSRAPGADTEQLWKRCAPPISLLRLGSTIG